MSDGWFVFFFDDSAAYRDVWVRVYPGDWLCVAVYTDWIDPSSTDDWTYEWFVRR
jgi:hypothetical protein